MNKQLFKKLYEEAAHKAWSYDFDPDTAERFAELIIRECAAVAYSYDPLEPVPSAIAKLIQTHFGVEE